MKLAVLGTVGIPARYGGFETLAENLVNYISTNNLDCEVTVYCSAKAYLEKAEYFKRARLRYSRLQANGMQSVLYDVVTALSAVVRGHDRLLMLGVSGAMIIPFLRLLSSSVIVTNVDGIEWRRDKWKGIAKLFLRWSEAIAVRYSHHVIADNQGIADYLRTTYGKKAEVIAYGGDHAANPPTSTTNHLPALPDGYALSLCRIEPENNVEMILEAFSKIQTPLVFVGNWSNSDYGLNLLARYKSHPSIHLLPPIYDSGCLYSLRQKASCYVHGHSAGGTNPSLVEMMHFGLPIFTYDCVFNRYTTEHRADYFRNADELSAMLVVKPRADNGTEMRHIANLRYRWEQIGKKYVDILQQ